MQFIIEGALFGMNSVKPTGKWESQRCSGQMVKRELAPQNQSFRTALHPCFSQGYFWMPKLVHVLRHDFSILAATPIFFPIGWHNSKIPGYAVRVRDLQGKLALSSVLNFF